MTRQAILQHLAKIFNTPYYIEERWKGGVGPTYVAEPVGHPIGLPDFLLAVTPRGYYIAYTDHAKYGIENVDATRWLALNRNPLEVTCG